MQKCRSCKKHKKLKGGLCKKCRNRPASDKTKKEPTEAELKAIGGWK